MKVEEQGRIVNDAITARTIKSTTSTTKTQSSCTHFLFFFLRTICYIVNRSSVLKRAVAVLIPILSISLGDVEAMTVQPSTSTALYSSRLQSQQPKTCAIIGVGVLGTSLCKQILSSPDFQNVVITGITKSYDRHELIREQIGYTKIASRLTLTTIEELIEKKSRFAKFDNVIFCAPPSGFEDYPSSVKEAIEDFWSGPENGGVFIFTSSGAVYGDVPGIVSETTPTADTTNNPRVERLVKAEQVCLNAGGCCLRLAGLYDLTRGAHNYWITSGKPISSSPDGMVNLLHYYDAASACVAALKAGASVVQGKVFLISDNHPLSRYLICEFALQARVYQQYDMPEFTGTDEQPWAKGKIYEVANSMKALNWQPFYPSFEEFMESNS